jgi:hypothetical protein
MINFLKKKSSVPPLSQLFEETLSGKTVVKSLSAFIAEEELWVAKLLPADYQKVSTEYLDKETYIRLEFLKKIPFFYGMREREIRGLVIKTHEINSSIGNYTFHEGDQPDGMYLICEGEFEICA